MDDSRLPIVTFRDTEGQERKVTLRHERPVKEPGPEDQIRLVYPKGNWKRARPADWQTSWLWPLVLVAVPLCLVAAFGVQVLLYKLGF
jgi:hypothetical protein